MQYAPALTLVGSRIDLFVDVAGTVKCKASAPYHSRSLWCSWRCFTVIPFAPRSACKGLRGCPAGGEQRHGRGDPRGLSERFELRVRGTTASRRITGTYEGPLRHVLARVLVGYDYVIKPNGANIDVIVLSTGAPRAARPAPAPPPVRRRAD